MLLAQLIGTRGDGTIQISEAALNEALTKARTQGTPMSIALLPNNVVHVTYGVFREHVALPRSINPAVSPSLTVQLSSWMVAIGLGMLVRQPYIRMRGRQVTIDLAEIPALQPWRALWSHIPVLTFETLPGALRVGFAIAIDKRS
jgi:hypothetical protein